MSSSNAGPGAALRCAAHPKTETYLRCAQCQTPICPRCLVMTPVGAKCRACARPRRLPTFEVTPLTLVSALIATFFAALVLGIVGSILVRLSPLFLMIFPFGVGLVIAEVINRIANRKRHTILRVIAGAGVVFGYFVLSLGDFLIHGPLVLLGSGMVIPLALNALVGIVESPFTLLFLIIGIWVAAYRVG